MPSRKRGVRLTLMGKIYTDYDEYLQDAYEQQSDRYANSNNVNNERAQEATRQ